MTFGLSSTGFKKKRLSDIIDSLKNNAQTEFGNDVSLESDSLLGQVYNTIANEIADTWEAAEGSYQANYPKSADGISLDNATSIIGIERIEAASTVVNGAVTGIPGITIGIGSQVKVSITDDIYQSTIALTLSPSVAIITQATVNTITDSTDYTIIIDDTNYTIDSGVGATADSIIAALQAAIAGGSQAVTATDLGSGTIKVESDDKTITINIVMSSNLTIDSVTNILEFTALETGEREALIGTLDFIVTAISGWTGITNYVAGQIGRDQETDTELRVRRNASTRVLGSGSLEAIKARLNNNVEGITSVQLFENRSTLVVDGRPGKSFEVVIEGGSDTDIANNIWLEKPAGIETFGNTTVVIQDTAGNNQGINFSRPVNIYCHIEVDISLFAEESYPASGNDVVKQSIVDTGNALAPGQDVILQRFLGGIYSSVSGIQNIVIRIATSPTAQTPPGSFTTNDLAIDEAEKANFDISRVTVSIV